MNNTVIWLCVSSGYRENGPYVLSAEIGIWPNNDVTHPKLGNCNGCLCERVSTVQLLPVMDT